MQIFNNYKRIWILARFELTRLFLTKRGIIALAAFATVWFIILYYLVSSAVTIVSSQSFQEIAKQLFGALGLADLLNWPVPELAIYWLIAAYLFPSFALFSASDQTCSDRTRGTLRFISLRATRAEIIFGRFLGQVLITEILLAVTIVATVLMASYRDFSLLGQGIYQAISLFINLSIIVMPFIALMTLLNSFLQSSKMAIVVCTLIFGLGPFIISIIAYQLPIAEKLNHVFPGGQIAELLGRSEIAFTHYSLPIIQTILFLIMANIIMKRTSL
ncbi:MAG: Cu-processing system permease protein [Alteromonadaceae bacterium]|jgi:Cu-processing system permease protein